MDLQIEYLINTKFELNNEQHKNILERLDNSINMSNQIIKQHEDWLKSLDKSVKEQGRDITFAKGLVSVVSVISTLAVIASAVILFF